MKVMIIQELNAANRLSVPMAHAFQTAGAATHWVTVASKGPLHELLQAAGVPASSLGCSRALHYPAASARLATLARKSKIDVILAIEPIAATIAGLSRWLYPTPVVVYSRQHVYASVRAQEILSRIASELASCTLCLSRAAAEAASNDDGVSASRVRVSYGGVAPLRTVDDAELKAVRERLGIEDGALTVVIVARLRTEKGHATLLSAVGAAAKRLSRPVHLAVVGSGPAESDFKALLPDAAPARVHFVGHQDDVAPWYALADIVAMPSYREAFGLAAVEAMSAGCTLVASGVGGLLEVIEDGVSGLLVQPKNVLALAGAILKVSSDPALARSLGDAARNRYMQNFRVETAVANLCKIFRELLNAKR